MKRLGLVKENTRMRQIDSKILKLYDFKYFLHYKIEGVGKTYNSKKSTKAQYIPNNYGLDMEGNNNNSICQLLLAKA